MISERLKSVKFCNKSRAFGPWTANKPFSIVVSFIKIDVQGLEKNVLDGALKVIKRDNPVIIFEHSDLYFKDPSQVRKQISDLFSLQSYEIFLIRNGEKEFKYLFLEDVDFLGSSDNLDGDFIAIPTCLTDIGQFNVQWKCWKREESNN